VKLTALAQKIGPEASEVLGDHAVDPRLIEHFHARSGYSRPAEDIDVASITTAFENDLAAVSA
jgi:hypothetical protein